MPKWGLTDEQLDSTPWGLDREMLLASKTITNSVEGDVYLTRIEQLAVDSPPIQRLRRVAQLGNSHLVYPDATHRRFSHVLGALRVSQDLLDAIFDHHNRPHAQDDLFLEWRRTKTPDEFAKAAAEVTVLVRLGALLHDLCHIPFGHTVEDDLGLLQRHDANNDRFEHYWRQMDAAFKSAVSPELQNELRRLILSKEVANGFESKYPFAEDLVGNTICADLLDYLERDHQALGLPIGLGHRFIEGMYVTRSDHPDQSSRAVVQIAQHGHHRADVESELLKSLRYRYEESERVLVHHAKLAADAMLGKLISMWRDALWTEEVKSLFGEPPAAGLRDVDELRDWVEAKSAEELVTALPSVGGHGTPHSALIAEIDGRVEAAIEEGVRWLGDDGLLERLLSESQTLSANDGRRKAMAELAGGVLNRKLFKLAGRSRHGERQRAEAQRIWDRYGSHDERRRLEVEVAEYIGLEDKWHIVLWIPHPDMKLKIAEVLVGGLQNDTVDSLHNHSNHCKDIYDSHADLWAVSVFVHPALKASDLKRDVALAFLRERLRIDGWENGPEADKESIAVEHFALEHDLGQTTKQRLLIGTRGLTSKPQSLNNLIEQMQALQRAGLGSTPS